MNSLYDSSLPKDQKINKASEYQYIIRNGQRVNNKNLTIIISPNSLGFPRIGLVVGKKVSKKAVKRNRIKRVLREVFRQNKTFFGSNDIIFIVREDVSDLTFQQLKAEIFDCLKQRLQ